jgi:tetratricopeptide (TPR) repeat protein
MKALSLAALLVCLAAPPLASAGQGGRQGTSAKPADPVAEAYAQFMLGHRLEDEENIDGAIAAYKRAMALDPQAAEIVAELADLYMRQNRMQEAMATAEQALKVSSSIARRIACSERFTPRSRRREQARASGRTVKRSGRT